MSERILKSFLLSEDEMEVIREAKEQEGYQTEVAALRHILFEYKKMQNEEEQSRRVAEEILRIFSTKYEEYWKRLYSSVRASDKTLVVIQDVLNTILIAEEYENCIPVDSYTSPVMQESIKNLKRKIAKRKQKKDRNRRRKRQTNV